MYQRPRWSVLIVVVLSCVATGAGADEVVDSPALDVFEQRIMPIFKSPEPSSCVQCHLSSVDLKQYILPSQEQTFVALRDKGLIDVQQPAKSKILQLIQMGEQDQDELARRIHAKNRQLEYAAFSAWIEACCADPALRDLPPLDPSVATTGPVTSDAVIRHARKSRVLDSFVRNIWSQRMRCFPCHTPHEIDEDNPRHEKPAENYANLKKTYGARMDIFRETPLATMRALMRATRSARGHLPLVNLKDPEQSLLVLKPTSKLPPKNDAGEFEKPSYSLPVSHMGGLKMHPNDLSYKAFVAWIQDYARVVEGDYESASDLPADDWYPTQQILRVRNAPAEWPALGVLQFRVFRRDEQTGDWEANPIAFTQGLVTPRRMVNGPLFLLAEHHPGQRDVWSQQGAKLTPGKYLLKAYLDSQNRLEDDPTIFLSDEDYVGRVEVEAAWREGFPQAEMVEGESFRE